MFMNTTKLFTKKSKLIFSFLTIFASLAIFAASVSSFNNSNITAQAASISCPSNFSPKSSTQAGYSQVPGQALEIDNSKLCLANDVNGRVQSCSMYSISFGWNGDSGRCNTLGYIGQASCSYPFSSKEKFVSGTSLTQNGQRVQNSSVCFYIGNQNCLNYTGAWNGEAGNCNILKPGAVSSSRSSSNFSSSSRFSSYSSYSSYSNSSSYSSSTSLPPVPNPNNQQVYILVEKWGLVNGQVTKVSSSGNWLNGVYSCNQPISTVAGVDVSGIFAQCARAKNLAGNNYLFAYIGQTDQSFGSYQQKFMGFTYSPSNSGSFVNWFNFNQSGNSPTAANWELI